MRVTLAHPGIYDARNPHAFPPWGALCVATALLDAGHDVEVLDLNGLDPAEALNALLAGDPEVVGFTGKTGNSARRLRRLIDDLRDDARYTGRIAVGGPLVASYPGQGDVLWRGVDALFQGDGEAAFTAWLDAGASPSFQTTSHEIADLDGVGIPSWWGGLASYVHPAEDWPNMNVPSIHVAAARGCTRRCTFCYLTTQYPGKRFRFVSAPRLMADLDTLASELAVSGFYFVDDCFIDRERRRLGEFVALNIGAGSPYRYGCDVQLPDLEDLEMLRSMHEAGFRALYVGVEAASDRVRAVLGKGRTGGDLAVLMQRVLDLGFTIRASIGVGWPGETRAEAERTLGLIDRVPDLAFDAFRFQPLPGTPLSRRRHLSPSPHLGHAAFEDYSGLNDSNASAMSDADLNEVWEALLHRQNQRLAKYLAAPRLRAG